jgi:hypothetical protein
MSNVFVTTRLQGSGHTAVPVHMNGTVSDPPPGLEKLENGDLLQGTVVGHDKKGRLLVRTNLGVLHISTQQSLPEGTEVTLQIRHAGARLHVLILQAGNTTGPAPPRPHDVALPQGAGPRPPAGDSILLGQRINAAVIASPSTPVPGLEATIPPGTVLLARVVSVGLPPNLRGVAPNSSAIATTPGNQSAPDGRNAQIPTQGQKVGTPQTAATAGTISAGRANSNTLTPEMLKRVTTAAAQSLAGTIRSAGTPQTLLKAHPDVSASSGGPLSSMPHSSSGPGTRGELPGEPASRASGAPSSMRITGQVVGATGEGQPVLRTALGLMTLAVRTTIPIRSSVAIEISLSGLKAAPVGAGVGGHAPTGISAVPEAVSADPMMTLGNLQLPAPEAGPRLAPGILLFLSALKGGRLSQWLSGADVRQLRSSGAATADFTAAEAAGLTRSIETGSGEWRLYLIPLLHETLRENLRLYVRSRDDKPERTGSQGEGKTRRFIVEAELSGLGSVQLDGFVAPKRFDLIFRSEKALSGALRQGIKDIHDRTLRSEDWRGQVSFSTLSQDAFGGASFDSSNTGGLTI